MAVTHRETSPWVQDGGESQPPPAPALWWGGEVVGTPLHPEFGDAMACPAAGTAGEGSSPRPAGSRAEMPRCAEAQRETEAGGVQEGPGCEGLQRCSAAGPPPSPRRAAALPAGGGSWWAGEHQEQPVAFRGGLSGGVGTEPAVFPSPGSSSSPAAPPGAGLGSPAGCGRAPAGREDEEDFTEPELDAAFAPRKGHPVHSGPPVPLSPACGWAGFGFPRGAGEPGGGWTDRGAARSKAAAVTFAGG